jgi:hypothetical protein
MMRGFGRRRLTGAGLLLGGLMVLGLWAFLGWLVPLLLLGVAMVLAWNRSAVGVAASVLGAGILFWTRMAFGWIAWTVGIVLIGTGILLVAWPSRREVPQDTRGG